jgi:hypothetical protein
MLDQTDAYIWTLIALAHAESAMAEATTVSCYLDTRYSIQRNTSALNALIAAACAAANAHNAIEFLVNKNYEGAFLAGHEAYEALVQARHAVQDAACDDADACP